MVKQAIVLLGVAFVGMFLYFILRRGGGPGGPPPLPPAGRGVAAPPDKVKTAAGSVQGFGSNPHQDVNAIVIQIARSGVLTIDFRPHTAQAVIAVAAPGDSVVVEYSTNPNDEVVGYRLRRIKNIRNGKEAVLDALPPPPDIPPNHSAEYFTIHQPNLVLDHYGGIVAIKSGQLLFHFKPGLVDDILPIIKTSEALGLTAVWRDDHFGFVNVNRDKVYIVLSVTIGNKTFLVR